MLKKLLFLCLMVCPAGFLFAQSEVGGATVNGAVTDPSGALIAGATVKLSSAATGFTRSTTSNGSGLYTFVRVPVGTYTLEISQPGFNTTRREGIRLDVGALATLDVQLQVGGAQEAVTVQAEIPIIETGRSQTSTTVNDRGCAT